MSTNSTDPKPPRASVDIVDIVDGVVRPNHPAHDSPVIVARLWRIHWPEIEPTLIRYQDAVDLYRVLGEHRAAVGAEPMETKASGNASMSAGPSGPLPTRVIRTSIFL